LSSQRLTVLSTTSKTSRASGLSLITSAKNALRPLQLADVRCVGNHVLPVRGESKRLTAVDGSRGSVDGSRSWWSIRGEGLRAERAEGLDLAIPEARILIADINLRGEARG
jgi:hypothetical protein